MMSAKFSGFWTSSPLSVPNSRNLPSFGQKLANLSLPLNSNIIYVWPPLKVLNCTLKVLNCTPGVHAAPPGARFLVRTLSRALLYAGILLSFPCCLTCLENVPTIFNQVPEVMHYRESVLDKSIIVFIICLNVAEFLCHIFIFRARF